VVKYSDYFKLTQSVCQIFKSRNATVNIYKTATLWGFSLKNTACFYFNYRPNYSFNDVVPLWMTDKGKVVPVLK